MRSVVVSSMGLVALATVIGLAWAYETGMGSSRARVEREHGVRIPVTAEDILCKGDAWGGFFDQGAVTQFHLPIEDLGAFVAQLETHAEADVLRDKDLEGSELMELTGGRPLIDNRLCTSPTGSRLAVRIWRLDGKMLAVNMHTDWD